MPAKYLDANFSRNRHFAAGDKCADLADLPLDATEVQINRATRNLDRIGSFKKLRKLSLASMKVDCLEEVSQLKSLEILAIGYSPYAELSPLAAMGKLKCLLLSNLKKVESIDFVRGLASIKALEIADMPKVIELAPLAELSGLEELKIESGGAAGKQLTVNSLEPLASLGKLKYLWLFVVTKAMSLQPLSELKQLKQLSMNGFYPWQEYAKLAACLPKVDSRWLRNKYFEAGHPQCKKCGARRAITPPGKGKRAFCGDCHPQKIEELVAEYDEQFAIGAAGDW